MDSVPSVVKKELKKQSLRWTAKSGDASTGSGQVFAFQTDTFACTRQEEVLPGCASAIIQPQRTPGLQRFLKGFLKILSVV